MYSSASSSPTPSPLPFVARLQALAKGKGRAEGPASAPIKRHPPTLSPDAFDPAAPAEHLNAWLDRITYSASGSTTRQLPQPLPRTMPRSPAPPNPWEHYAATPEPVTAVPLFYPQQVLPAPAYTSTSFYQPELPPLGVVPAGSVPTQPAFCMPSNPINQQHGPVVPEAVLAQVNQVDTVENMNVRFPFMFAQHRQIGSASAVFVSDHGHMHYYAWGDDRGVAMLTMTVPVYRMQELQNKADAAQIARTDAAAPRPYLPKKRPRQRKPRAD